MKNLLGVIKYEFKMSIKRWGVIIFSLLLLLFYGGTLITNSENMDIIVPETTLEMWQEAAQVIFSLNLFFPVFAGILAADRLVRDNKLGTDELLKSSQLKPGVYLWGKYIGVLLSLFLPVLVVSVLLAILFIILGGPWLLLITYPVTAFVIALPSYIFIMAFSLICPLFMPVRVYQILFTGYWYWGNYINPEFIPSLSDTVLNASGRFAAIGFYGVSFGMNNSSPTLAITNIVVLCGIAVLVLIFGEQYLLARARRA